MATCKKQEVHATGDSCDEFPYGVTNVSRRIGTVDGHSEVEAHLLAHTPVRIRRCLDRR